MDDGTCNGCIHAKPVISDEAYPMTKCHRYPPVVVVLNDEMVQTSPDAGIRCGEYKEAVEVETNVLYPKCLCGHAQNNHVNHTENCYGCDCLKFQYNVQNQEGS